ncbi:putative transcription factor WD40-like family [Medicago truncatula]|uniref:Putative transcription factor WD40-like family n=1 Tax=Medicago truncatula TaxID=3880 RepID=A0A396ICY2_MEDTR|nr:protein JINGUBANG isoform X2 [Medicago truncatula]RHN63422.1 putative transcription factor WD40-like family [Medicago truncatula]
MKNDFTNTITTFLHLQQKQNPISILNYQYLTSIKTLTPHITCLAVHRNLLYAASLNLINVFDLSSHHTLIDTFNETSTSGFVKSITFSGSRVFTAHQDCKVRVWLITSSKTHRLLSSLPTVKDRLRRCIVPKNYVSVRRHRKSLWIQHNDTVSGLAVNKKEKLMYSVSWDKTFKIWDLSSADGCIKVWKMMDDQVKRYTLVSMVGKQKPAVNALALNSDGTVLFSGGSDGTICQWQDKQNDIVLKEKLRGHSGAILCLVNVDDLLASGSADLTVRIWQREKGGSSYCCRGVLEGHEKPVKSLVAISGGGEDDDEVVTLFSGSLDGDIRVWEVFGLV